MKENDRVGRRAFLKQAAGAVGAAAQIGTWPALAQNSPHAETRPHIKTQESSGARAIDFPRGFGGQALKTIAFPLGGVAAGSLSLGGRGQLRDWEIFNRPNKGYSPAYAFPSIWVQSGSAKPIARVLEARILPPYDGQDGLGSNNAPGLSRIEEAEFIGAYPFARIRFKDSSLPVQIELEAFSPFIPHDPDDSGLPVAILRYHVGNPTLSPAKVGIALSVDNPVKVPSANPTHLQTDSRVNERRTSKEALIKALI